MKRNLILVGFMGSGKTTAGRAIAHRLGLAFVDTDDLVVRAAGRSIAEIFTTSGETAFRRLEREAVKAAVREGPKVVSTGGGAVSDEASWRVLESAGLTAWLCAPFESLWARVAGDPARPLIADGDGKARAERLFVERRPLYARAQVHIDADRPVAAVVEDLTAAWRRWMEAGT